ncbi:hypothetical protein E2C01_045701 [Portunus trituberculatus]|uniref:Uncharacterized protein n=1 Tax=Portunus trituberculatus TaxID=210409 RepID=A0A5B7G2R5_PORTR|nr:hypothetical protein [Portunus trituberculatus]
MWKNLFSNILHTLPHPNLLYISSFPSIFLSPAPGLPCLSFQCHLLFYNSLLSLLSHFLQLFFIH